MTTFQDPPPQSRRAVRQSERGDAAEVSVGPTFVPPQPAPFADQHQRDMWDTTARRVAQLPTAQPRAEGEQPSAGRRAASVTPEPLNYSTQQRPQVPTYDGPFRNAQPTGDVLPPTQAIPKADQPTYRVRDYSPEARPAAAAWNAATAPAPTAPPTDLDYHTEARRLTAVPPLPPEPTPAPVSAVQPVAPAPVASAPAAPAPAAPVDAAAGVPETTLSRRELRAMLVAESTPLPSGQLIEPAPWPQAAQPQATPPVPAAYEPPAAAQLVEPAPWPPVAEPAPTAALPAAAPVDTPSDEPQAWPFSFGQPEAPVAAPTPVPAEPVQAQPVAPAQPIAPAQPEYTQPEYTQPEFVQPEFQAPVEDGARALFGDIMTPIATPLTVTPEVPEYSSPLPASAPQPIADTGLSNAITEFDALAFPQAGAVEQVAPATSSPASVSTESAWSPPVGHWSTQGDLDDETQPYESTINRRIGSGSATTNALVLPTPDRDIRGALTGTGEVMLTGSIDLPMTLSSTGASARVEHESLDMLFDANDHEIVATDSAPVRAIRAVSTHNTGHGVTHTQKPKGNRSLTVLFVIAGCLAVATIAVFVTVFVINPF